MRYTPRTIAYICELVHRPVAPDAKAIQRLHNRLFEEGSPPYSSFALTPIAPVLSNPVARPGVVSQVAFMADRFQFREELGALTCEGFAQRVRTITEMAAELRGIELFNAQQVTIRSLVNPRHHRDSREFLKHSVFGFGNEIEVLGREPHIYGLRMMFPPERESPTANALRIESYAQDPRSLYIENQGTFAPLPVERGLEPVADNVQTTYRFLIDRALPFLAAFDQPAGT